MKRFYTTEEIARMELADVQALKKEGAEKILEGINMLDEAREIFRYREDLYREKAEQMGGRMNRDAALLIIASGQNGSEAKKLFDLWFAMYHENVLDDLSKITGKRYW